MTGKSFSEFIRTATDDERQAVYKQAMKKATEEQNKVLEEAMEQIEQEHHEPLVGVVETPNKRVHIFKTLEAMLNFIRAFKIHSATYRSGFTLAGELVFELVYDASEEGRR
jgi:hypothetical protein